MRKRCEYIMYVVDIICFLFLLIVSMATNNINILQIICLIVLFFNILLSNTHIRKKYTRIEIVKRFNEYRKWNKTYPSLFSKDAVIALKKDTNKMNRLLNEIENRKASIIVEFDKGNVITKCSNCGQNVNIIDEFCRNCGCQFIETKKQKANE